MTSGSTETGQRRQRCSGLGAGPMAQGALRALLLSGPTLKQKPWKNMKTEICAFVCLIDFFFITSS